MHVSVVMAAYDAEPFVADAVQSVVDQTHRDWELVVVDDGSRDRTADVVREFADPRIRVLSTEHSGVLGSVRNVGIDATRGAAVALLDADDVWLPQKLELQVACLEERPEVGLVHTAADLLTPHGLRDGPALADDEPLLRRLLERNFIYSSSVLVRRGLLDEHGPFDPDPGLGGSPDYDLWLRLAPHTRFASLAQALLLYRVHGAQMSGDARAMQESALAALQKLRERDPDAARREAAAFALAVGIRRQLAGHRGRGRRELLAAVRRRPGYPLAWRWLLRSFVRSA
jgi:glycosyltransferase involved in cell wall biosynthesis